MANLPLYSLILYNLLQVHVKNVAIFHCWTIADLHPLALLLSSNYIYAQFIDLQQPQLIVDFQKRYLDHKLTKLGVFLDTNCQQAAYITNQSSSSSLYTHHFHWLLFDPTGNLTQLEQLFSRANLSLNADVTYVRPEADTQNASSYTLYDVYSQGSHIGGCLNITIDQSLHCNRSHCRVASYLSDLYKRTRVQQRLDLSGITFRMVMMITERPLNSSVEELLGFLLSEESLHLDHFARFGMHLVIILQELLRFNMSYIWRNVWSTNDYIGGGIGDLVNEVADLSSSPFALSPGRRRYVSPIVELGEFRSLCIFRTPRNAVIKPFAFLAPFQPEVWCVFGALLLVTGMLLWLIFRLEQQRLRRCLDFLPSLLTSCLICFGTACIQSSILLPRSTGGRLAFWALMVTSILMYNYYTSIVVATLLGSPMRSDIKTIQQLADSSLDVAFDPVPYIKNYVLASPRTDIRDLVKYKMESKRNQSSYWLLPRAGALKVRNHPGFVFISDSTVLYHYVEKYFRSHEICEINEISLRPESSVYTMVPIHSAYKELLKQLQFRIQEAGIIQKYRLKYTKTKLHCFNNNIVINVGMEYAAPLFIALLIAYFLALLMLLLELIWQRIAKRRKLQVRLTVEN